MKTFITALLIMAVVLTFVICNTVYITGKIDAMLDIAESLPADADAFDADYNSTKEAVERLWQMWDHTIDAIAFTSGYDNINRADDAITTLCISYRNQNGDDFSVARQSFCDSMKRLRKLESFHPDGLL